MGHRIELGEIELNVHELEGTVHNCCIYDQDQEKIILYYVGNKETKEVKAYLKAKLPRYMLPNRVIKLEQMPLNTKR